VEVVVAEVVAVVDVADVGMVSVVEYVVTIVVVGVVGDKFVVVVVFVVVDVNRMPILVMSPLEQLVLSKWLPFSFDLLYLPYYFVNFQIACVRLVLPPSPINPRAPSREGTTTNLAVSPTTNSQYPGLPWQSQS